MYNYIDFSQFRADEFLVYLRKSQSDDPLLSVEEVLSRHERILDEWAERNIGRKVPSENKFREVVSGETISARPEVQKVLRMIESPSIKAVLIIEVERLSRGDLEDAGRLMKLFRYTNTLVITPQEVYDLRTEYGRDRFERELKRGHEYLEYTKKIRSRGTLLSVSMGNYVGSVAPYGYDKAWVLDGKRKCPTLTINEEQANVVRMIFDLYVNENLGMTNVANRLEELGIKPLKAKHFSTSSIKDILINDHYIGKVKWNWRKTVISVEDSEIIKTRPKAKNGDYLIYDGRHEAIISEELFRAAQDKLGRTPRTKASRKTVNPLAGLIYCQCGRAIIYRPTKKQGDKPRLQCPDQKHCKTGSCTFEEMMDIVKGILQQSIEDFEIHIKNENGESVAIHESLVKSLEAKMQELEAKELAQWEAQANPDPSQRMPAEIFKKLNERLLAEKEEVRTALINARNSTPDPVSFKEKRARFQEALNALLDPNVDAGQKNRLLKACIERIDYKREAPQRVKNPEPITRTNTRMKGKSAKQTAFPRHGQWESTPIEIDVKLKV